MFDVKSVNARYFEVKLSLTDDNGEIIKSIDVEVESPKVKLLKRLTGLSKAKENTMEELTKCINLILNKNKENKKIPLEYIDDMDFDEMSNLLTSYFEWLSQTKNLPN
ncbi:hypothetical protein FDA33_06045 [Clostridium botulinum]|uniref:hypothetical protein n=1 Tax=Clostridium sp. ZBS4 TaxID=2949974 RepID=UPI0013F06B94|nr:hypothetical protein [Clostridium sp. ZBS4]NFH89767.1 hypothetical protein [Clostridium botulinum]NFI18289.1 hypothetical protein [Clostridium botulinum]NFL93835.1 hypothetical protein [Clostridium botulinum]NFN50914.1 hypothetical protein [Clostridium botulinum]NFO28365.1 hypothetical protein [Clostridium botulinum]